MEDATNAMKGETPALTILDLAAMTMDIDAMTMKEIVAQEMKIRTLIHLDAMQGLDRTNLKTTLATLLAPQAIELLPLLAQDKKTTIEGTIRSVNKMIESKKKVPTTLRNPNATERIL